MLASFVGTVPFAAHYASFVIFDTKILTAPFCSVYACHAREVFSP
jgi:hypothetical protein